MADNADTTLPTSFFFANAKPGDPLSWQALQTRRKIAEAMAGRQRSAFPQTLGEGLTYAGEKLADAFDLRNLDAQEHQAAIREEKLLGGMSSGGSHIPGGTPASETTTATPGGTGATAQDSPQIQPPYLAEHIPGANAGSPVTGFQNLGRNFKPPPAPVHMQPVINAGRFNPTITNLDSGNKVIAGQLSPDTFSNRAYGPLGDAPEAKVVPDAAPDTRDMLAGTLIAQSRPPLTQIAALSSGTATDASGGPDIPSAALSPDPIGATPRVKTPPLTAQAPSYANPPIIAPADMVPVPKGLPPSAEPIPPATEQVMKPPGEPPRQPGPVPLSGNQRNYLKLINNPNVSPAIRAQAKELFEVEEKFRSAKQQEQASDYIAQRTQHHQDSREYDKFVRERADRNIKQMGERLGLEKTQAEIEKMYYEQGEPRQIARAKSIADLEQTQAEIILKRQQAVKPVTETVEGKVYERPPGSPSGTPFTRATGIEEPDKLTEHQQAMLQYFQTAVVTNRQLPKDESITGLRETLTGKIPVLGNYTLSPEYRNYRNAAEAWLLAHVRNQSGAVIGKDEIKNYWSIYFPVPGDDKKELLNKQERRATLTEGLYNAVGGGAGKAAADKFLQQLKDRDETKYPEGTTRTSKSTGRQQILRGGKWTDM